MFQLLCIEMAKWSVTWPATKPSIYSISWFQEKGSLNSCSQAASFNWRPSPGSSSACCTGGMGHCCPGASDVTWHDKHQHGFYQQCVHPSAEDAWHRATVIFGWRHHMFEELCNWSSVLRLHAWDRHQRRWCWYSSGSNHAGSSLIEL